MFTPMREDVSKKEVTIDINNANDYILPITLDFEVGDKYVINRILSPIKTIVFDYVLVGRDKSIITQTKPKTIELCINFELTENTIRFNDMVGKLCYMSFKDKSILDKIYGYIVNCSYELRCIDGAYVTIDFAGVIGTFSDTQKFKRMEKEDVKEQIRKIRRRFHFD